MPVPNNVSTLRLSLQLFDLRRDFDQLSESFIKAVRNHVDMENELVRCRAGAPGLAVIAIKVGQLRTRSTGSTCDFFFQHVIGMTNLWKKRTCILTTQALYIFRYPTVTIFAP